jgi:hypothetical protein
VLDLALLLRDLSTLLHPLDVISVGKHLTAFLICNGHVGHKSLDEGSFPDFFFGTKGVYDLLVSFE